MTVFGLEKILSMCHTAWQPFYLRNTKLVVDALDLTGYLCNEFQFSIYGGENLSFAWKIRSLFLNLKSHEVEPYFIFRGRHDKTDNQVLIRIKRASKTLMDILNAVELCNLDRIPQIMSIASTSVFLDVLMEFEWSYVKTKYSSFPVCTNIAALLHCPVIASTSDYLITISMKQNAVNDSVSESHVAPAYVPLNLTCIYPSILNPSSRNSDCDLENKYGSAVLTHKFIHQQSDLAKISNFHLPLFATLLGVDTFPRLRIPLHLQERIKVSDQPYQVNKRWSVLIDWFSKFHPDSMKPLDEIVNCYPIGRHASILKDLMVGVSRFICPLHESNEVMSFLLQKSSSFPSKPPLVTTTFSLKSSKNFKFQDVVDLLKGTKTPDLSHEDFTSGWPHHLLDAFRSCRINPPSCVYLSSGVFLPTTIEDPKCPFSVYDSSFLIRRLHYQVYVTLEHNLGMQNKLHGLNPDVVEYARREDKLVIYRIPIIPLSLDFNKVTTDEVITSMLGFETLPNNNLIPEPLHSLAIVLALWFQQLKYTSLETPHDFNESTVGLAVAACAVANIYNEDISGEELCKYYESLSKISSEPITSGASASLYRPYIVHSFNAIQSTYFCLRDLVMSLNCLVPSVKQSNYFSFVPFWKLFPSGHLVHFLCSQLVNIDPSKRRYSITRLWIPRLLYCKKLDFDAAVKLQKMVNTLNSFLDLCNAIKISLPSSLDSFYTIHEVQCPDSHKTTRVSDRHKQHQRTTRPTK